MFSSQIRESIEGVVLIICLVVFGYLGFKRGLDPSPILGFSGIVLFIAVHIIESDTIYVPVIVSAGVALITVLSIAALPDDKVATFMTIFLSLTIIKYVFYRSEMY